MDADLHPPHSVTRSSTEGSSADDATRTSALIGSERFVEIVLSCMAEGARKAAEENAALKTPPKSP
jgi:hypothetical protein